MRSLKPKPSRRWPPMHEIKLGFAPTVRGNGMLAVGLMGHHFWKLVDKTKKHFNKTEKFFSVNFSHKSDFVSGFIPFFSNVIHPVLTVRWNITFVR